MIFSWGALILTVLQFLNKLFNGLQNQKLIDAGYDKAIAEQAALLLKNSKYSKEVMAKINAMSPDDVDKLLQKLEPN